MSKFDLITHTLSAAVGAGASFTVSYPSGKSADDYLGGTDHYLVSPSIRTLFAASNDFSIAFGASNITVTLISGVALADGSPVYLNVDRGDVDDAPTLADPAAMSALTLVKIGLGAPATADPDGVCATQALNTGALGVIAGALASGGVATFDKPRNVVAAWTTAAVLTVTGTDEFGNVVVESSASGTSFTGKKAFKTVTKVEVSANVTGLTVGSGVVLGLPVFLADTVDVLKEIMDSAAATAGTLVAGVQTTPTATTGDVRGTYSPNSAPNGSRVYELIAAVRAPGYTGAAQYAG